MPRFSANISTLFTELDFLERFHVAARAGFAAVEIQFPYAFAKEELAARAREAGVEVVLINLPAGDIAKGDRGIACLPARTSEFRDGVGQAIEYARSLGCRQMNCLAGIAPPRMAGSTIRETFVSNIRFAAAELQREGMTLLIEAINTRTVPGFYLRHSAQAIALIEEARAANVKLQYDLYHMQIMEGDLAKTLESRLEHIGHIQFADVPDRHEPGTGEINFPFLFDWLDRIGYPGWVGAEYFPSGTTGQSLALAQSHLRLPAGGTTP